MAREDAQDDAWRSIVDNYGDRAAISESEFAAEPIGGSATGSITGPVEGSATEHDQFGDDVDVPFVPEPYDDGAFIPPVPEQLRVAPPRLLAWSGVLGAPIAALMAVILTEVTPWSLPDWLGWLFVVAFLGGFGYLVATMPKERDDPFDDGARL